ncbi:Hint domain-containing protein [Granulibacter bethesdensis]|uniref:Hint domain-containing protein n=1 Tax=Granulibacter bethesdensis TaxID=364410 RepID=UPI0012FD8117|nr:Hint domain-containing protein [Granulibacter bethesdensis]
MILTTTGEVPVERFDQGASVANMSRCWTRFQRVIPNIILPDALAGYPIRILPHAIADGIPVRTTFVTPDQCLIIAGYPVPARTLVNGRSIAYDRTHSAYDAYTLATEQQAPVVVNGIPLMSVAVIHRQPRIRTEEGQQDGLLSFPTSRASDDRARIVTQRAIVEAIFHRLRQRSRIHGIGRAMFRAILSYDPAFYLLGTDDRPIPPLLNTREGWKEFLLPPGISSVRLLSRTSRPCESIGPFIDDQRLFGVQVGEITLTENRRCRPVTSHLTDVNLPGWHDNTLSSARWTRGDALLNLTERQSSTTGFLAIRLLSGGPYIIGERDLSTVSCL